jgi:hypothetical protein
MAQKVFTWCLANKAQEKLEKLCDSLRVQVWLWLCKQLPKKCKEQGGKCFIKPITQILQ